MNWDLFFVIMIYISGVVLGAAFNNISWYVISCVLVLLIILIGGTNGGAEDEEQIKKPD